LANILSGRKIARNVMAMATGEAPAEVAATELPEIVKAVQEAVRIELSFSFCSEEILVCFVNLNS
jgi:hypothetical protein